MIVSHSQKFIFVHLHKTAGTSVMKALTPLLSNEDVVISAAQKDTFRGLPVPPQLNLNKHSSALRISQSIDKETWNSYFKFAFVRHPFDRLVSLYEFLKRVRRNNSKQPNLLRRLLSKRKKRPWDLYPDEKPWRWLEMKALLNSTDFSGFIRSEQLAKAQGAKPQAQSLTNRRGELLVDFVGKVENIDDDWKKVCDRLGIESNLPHSNSSKRQFHDVSKYWNEQDVQFAMQKYALDFELFGYSLDGY